jgi:hypothetical protein
MGRNKPVSQMTDAQVLKACQPKVKGYKETELQKYPRPCLLCGVQVEGTMGDLERHQSSHLVPMVDTQYDYDNQAWVVNGKYENCAHPASMECGCYGRLHQGENAPSIH